MNEILKEKHIINMTKTPLKFMSKNGMFIIIQSSGEVKLEILRIEGNIKAIEPSGNEIKVNNTIVQSFKNLPERREDTIIVVPTIVYNALAHLRDDVYTIDEPYKEGGLIKYAKAISRQNVKSISDDFKTISSMVFEISNRLNSIDSPHISEQLKTVHNKLFKIRTITDKH